MGLLLLLNNDVELLTPQWGGIDVNALRPGVGCVGAQLHYPDGTIQHGGVILGIGGLASHAHRDLSANALAIKVDCSWLRSSVQ